MCACLRACVSGWSNYNPSSVGAEGFLGRVAPPHCLELRSAARSGCPGEAARSEGAAASRRASGEVAAAAADAEVGLAGGELPMECQDKCDWDTYAPDLEQFIMCLVCLVVTAPKNLALNPSHQTLNPSP